MLATMAIGPESSLAVACGHLVSNPRALSALARATAGCEVARRVRTIISHRVGHYENSANRLDAFLAGWISWEPTARDHWIAGFLRPVR